MTDKYTKIRSTSYVIREMKVKIPMRYQQAPIRMTKVQTLTAQNGRGDIEQQELSFTDRMHSAESFWNIDIHLIYDPAITPLGIYANKLKTYVTQ